MPSSSGTNGRVKLSESRAHRPPFDLNKASIPQLTPESRRCIQNLAAYRPPKSPFRCPKSRTAAVLVALFVGRMGDIYVLLSRRASHLRTYAGDTVLPGGKWDPGDKSYEATARREAYEEVLLLPPYRAGVDYAKVPLLCVLEPVHAMTSLIVIPVVVLILDNTLQPVLNQAEVAALFSHPLAGFLRDADPPQPLAAEPEMLEMKYHTFADFNSNTIPGKVRTHYFLTGREAGGTKPIFGLTAGMLIRVAAIGYGREPDFEPSAPDEPAMAQRIAYALRTDPIFRAAAVAEGIDPDRTPDPASFARRDSPLISLYFARPICTRPPHNDPRLNPKNPNPPRHMPQVYRRHSEHNPRPSLVPRRRSSMVPAGPQPTDADDSIVLADLVRTGEASRLRRRGAMRLDHNPGGAARAPPPPLPPLSNSNSNNGSAGPSSYAPPARPIIIEPSRTPSPEPEPEPGADEYTYTVGPVWRDWEGQAPPVGQGRGAEGVQAVEILSETTQAGQAYVLYCGGEEMACCEDDDEEAPPRRFEPSLFPASPLPAPSHSASRTPSSSSAPSRAQGTSKAARKTNGCGALVHVRAYPQRPRGFWMAKEDAAETVVGLDPAYCDHPAMDKMLKSACGCIREGIGCSVWYVPCPLCLLPVSPA
ncbi:hypothetical protein GSI_01261 [Ganoderma sinense ZZ0214-1]|uniref:Nudix hydrolase domain-containing protein n=1 Tax=Ganoderma sinense ZZ0214-1 TaxID=1077348 RepID=A0A2G8SUX6_9APHY|nr:hypothetical protein GSI_01261 [Ganoderma sinense ZZ0214-1]